MLMWLRHKLFGTEFVLLEFGHRWEKCKVKHTAMGRIFARPCSTPVILTEQDNLSRYNRWIWLYKNKEKAK